MSSESVPLRDFVKWILRKSTPCRLFWTTDPHNPERKILSVFYFCLNSPVAITPGHHIKFYVLSLCYFDQLPWVSGVFSAYDHWNGHSPRRIHGAYMQLTIDLRLIQLRRLTYNFFRNNRSKRSVQYWACAAEVRTINIKPGKCWHPTNYVAKITN